MLKQQDMVRKQFWKAPNLHLVRQQLAMTRNNCGSSSLAVILVNSMLVKVFIPGCSHLSRNVILF